MKILKEQYKLTLSSRAVLLDYCATINSDNLLKPIKEFNDSTIMSMLLHIANTYLFWLKRFAGKQEFEYFDQKNIKDIAGARKAFDEQIKWLLLSWILTPIILHE